LPEPQDKQQRQEKTGEKQQPPVTSPLPS